MLRILFVCSSLKPGTDGVGDYTRILAAECIRRGHTCQILAINDKHLASESVNDTPQTSGDVCIPCLRLSSELSWDVRMNYAHEFCRNFKPDIASLQFVCFGFHPKGLCFGLAKRLRELDVLRWHIMFHELWVGVAGGCKLRHRLMGFKQRKVVMELLQGLSPTVIHSHATPYVDELGKLASMCEKLELFSNISTVGATSKAAWELLQRESDFCARRSPRDFHIAGVFGSVHAWWRPFAFVENWSAACKSQGLDPLLVFFGKGITESRHHRRLLSKLKNMTRVITLGTRTETEIASLMSLVDFSISTMPEILIEKSSSAAASIEAGKYVVITNEKGGRLSKLPRLCVRVSELDKTAIIQRADSSEETRAVTRTATKFLDSLQANLAIDNTV